uniref:mastermind-like protein 1 n=1 Tax=Monopterus albus TaxID=43700 RepID=UPI0009B45470|nr:mastermind-like protein 1 [Monopterus albus]
MMADFVTPRHSAVMERLRRRIELFRQHHNSCENRYENATLERLELEQQQTIALHQRCLQAKAKRSNKHRQPQPSGDQASQRAPGGSSAELAESGGSVSEQSRNSTLIAHPKFKIYPVSYPVVERKSSDLHVREDGPSYDLLSSNGTHGAGGESTDSGAEPGSDFQRKEMKQEPDDILPIMPPSGGGNNSLFPDLNLNEQEWKELMEELNCSVASEDIQDILNDGFEDRKDPLELVPTPGGGGAVGRGAGGAAGGGGGQPSQGLLPPDLASVKTEFSPAFEQDSCIGSPHVRSTPSGPPPLPTSSPVVSSSATSPALPPSQPAPHPRQLQPPPNHILPPVPPVTKDLSPAQQLQHLAAQQQWAQHLHGQMQHKQPQPGAKFHNPGPHAHPPPWPQMANTSQSPLGGAFGLDKSTSPSLYPQDFNPNAQKQLLMPGQPNKGSPKAGASSYMPGPGGHPNMLGHPASGPPLSHPPAAGAQAPVAMLNYNNTKPLSHFEVRSGPPRPPNTQSQNKAALLTLLRQQQQIKQKNSMNFRQHLPHSQDQNTYPAPPHGPGPANSMASAPGNNAISAQPGAIIMAGNHGNAAYLSSQEAVAVTLKQQQQHQQQILEQQKQQQQQYIQKYIQRQQEKQRQQDQQLQRHLTRPPPQYQDQPGQDSPEFDLVFDNAVDQWVASSSAEKCLFVQILYHACQTYWESKAGSLGKAGKLGKLGRASQGAHHEVEAGPSHSSPGSESKILQARKKSYVPPRQTEFINCQSKLTGDACTMNLVIYRCKAFLNRLKKMMVANQSRSPGRGKAAVNGEKQRQQDQQLQRHLTRPPPQYQDQPGQPASQNPFPQQPVNQFTASAQPMGSVGSMGGPTPGAQRMFPQNQGMMGMNMGQGSGPAGGVAPSPGTGQTDVSLPSCGGRGAGAGLEVQQVLYNNMNLHPNHPAHPPQQANLQRQPLGSMSAPYRQNLLAQQQHLKAQPNAAMLKQQQLAAARMPSSMQNSMGASLSSSMPGSMQGAQSAAWQQQLASQPPSGNAGLPPNTFHMQQQPRIPKMPPGSAPFGANPGGRPMGALNPGQQMMQTNMAAAQQRAPPNPQSLGQPMANQQQTQQQQANQSQAVLPDLVAFGQLQSNGRQGLQCNQGYQVSRTASQQQVSFGYNVASGSFAEESELVDSLLKGQNAQEWMADLDELLASHQ